MVRKRVKSNKNTSSNKERRNVVSLCYIRRCSKVKQERAQGECQPEADEGRDVGKIRQAQITVDPDIRMETLLRKAQSSVSEYIACRRETP